MHAERNHVPTKCQLEKYKIESTINTINILFVCKIMNNNKKKQIVRSHFNESIYKYIKESSVRFYGYNSRTDGPISMIHTNLDWSLAKQK